MTRQLLNREVQCGSTRLAMLEAPAPGPLVVMLHGNSSCANSFRELLLHTALESFHLAAFDLPGHGASSRDESGDLYSIPRLAALLSEAVRDFGQQCVLVGHSVGGHIWSHAVESMNAVRGLVLISAPPIALQTLPAAFNPPNAASELIFRAQLSAAEQVALARALLGPAADLSTPDGFGMDGLIAAIANTDPKFRQALGASIARGQLADEMAALRRSALPAALIWGTEDTFLSRDFLANLRLPSPLSEGSYAFQGSGHSPHLDQLDRFARLLKDLIEVSTASR